MALSIGVQQGSRVQVGSHMLTVNDLDPMNYVKVTVNGRSYVLTEKERTEVMPEVFVSLGRNPRNPTRATWPGMPLSARLAFEAPRSIQITRQP